MKKFNFLLWYRFGTHEWVFEIVYSDDNVHANYRYPAKTIVGAFFCFLWYSRGFFKDIAKM